VAAVVVAAGAAHVASRDRRGVAGVVEQLLAAQHVALSFSLATADMVVARGSSDSP
jgi:fermentation-respiration switch protein FrsA (DUF1100 family)